MRAIEFDNVEFFSDSFVIFCAVMVHVHGIDSIRLTRAKLTSCECDSLAYLIRNFTELRILDLAHNELGDDGVELLSETFHVVHKLNDLNLENT